MITQEVTFNPDEAGLLALLRKQARKDGAITVSDTALIREMKLDKDQNRFFAAKMRLIAAGAISMYVDGASRQVIRLNMPDRKEEKSKRYIFTIVPMECLPRVRKVVSDYRRKKFQEETGAAAPTPGAAPAQPQQPKPGAKPATGEPPKPGKPAWMTNRNLEGIQKRAMERLGCGPLKPPLKPQGK